MLNFFFFLAIFQIVHFPSLLVAFQNDLIGRVTGLEQAEALGHVLAWMGRLVHTLVHERT